MSKPDQISNGDQRLRAQLEDCLQQRTHEVQLLNQELQAFSYTISHDLRAPLRAISGFSNILFENYAPNLPEEAQTLLNRVRSNAELMTQMIDNLLEFSRLSRQPMIQTLVDPAVSLRRALADLAVEQKDRHVEIKIGYLPSCQGDPELLQRVFFNLLSNALKYTRSREVACVSVGSALVSDLPPNPFGQDIDPAATAYFIRDNGAGFDMQYADKLFGLFQRLHSTSDYEGAGVGLAVVQKIIQRHGGLVWAVGAPDQGATFCFTLETKVNTDE
jgi:light-regulated signal transduction histidine kinase (bacteriophytochrome)